MRISGLVQSGLRTVTRLVLRSAVWVVAGYLLASVLLGVYTARTLGVNTDTADMISAALPWRRDFIAYQAAFPARVRNILVVIDGGTAALRDRATRAMLERIEVSPEAFDDWFAPGVGEPFSGNELLYLDTGELESLSDTLARAQPFLGRLRQDFSLATLFELLAEALERDALGATEALFSPVAETIGTYRRGARQVLDWGAALSVGGAANQIDKRFLVVSPRFDFSRVRPAKDALHQLRATARAVEHSLDEQVRIRLTGTVALEDEELIGVTKDSARAGALALGSVIVVLLLALRSLRLLVAALVTLIAGLTLTAAFAAWAVGSLNLISVAFAVLYIGLGINFVIHYSLRVRELCSTGAVLDAALESTSVDVGRSLALCALTTAFGFYSFIPTSFAGVSQLGLISGTGMFISLLTSLTLLPALIRLLFRNNVPGSAKASGWSPGLKLSALHRWRRPIIVVAMLLPAAALLAIPYTSFDNDPMALRDPDTESVQTFVELSASTDTAPQSLAVLLAAGEDSARVRRKLAAQPTVGRVISLSSFIPQEQALKRELLDDAALLLGPDFHRFPESAETDTARLREAVETLRSELAAGGKSTGGLATELDWLRQTLDKHSAERRREILSEIQHDVLGDLPRATSLLAEKLHPAQVSMDELPPEFTQRWRTADGYELLEVVPAVDISEDDAAQRFIGEVRAVAPGATGLPVVYAEAGQTVVDAFLLAFSLAAVAISAVLFIVLRSLLDTILVLAPVLMAALLTDATTVLLGMSFNFANIIALPLLLGIGVDNGIHVVYRVRLGLLEQGGVLATSTARAVFFGSLTTLASFGSLATSSHLGMASMGLMLGIGLIYILLFTLIVLPVFLSREAR